MAKVKQLWEYLMPFATDSTGVCSFFCDANAVVIGMDPGATTVRCYPFTEQRPDQRARYKGLRIGELDAVMGELDESVERMQELMEGENAEEVVLVGTPVASLLGVDLKALARRLEKRSGVEVMGFSTTGNRYYDEGLEEACRTVYEKMMRQNPEWKEAYRTDKEVDRTDKDGAEPETKKRINLLGFNTLDYPEAALRQQIREHLEKHQIMIGSIWGMESGRENWEHLFDADVNVVCSASGYRLAERIQKDTGMPYLLLDELLESTGGLELLLTGLSLPEQAERILLLGEQIRSGILRKAIREYYRTKGKNEPDIIQAGFFSMHKKLKAAEDVRLQSEADLEQMAKEGNFDLVIGDPMFRLLMSPSQTYLSQIHPPVSGNFAGQFSV